MTRKILLISSLCVVTFLDSCSSSEAPSAKKISNVTFTINGGGFNNQSVTLNGSTNNLDNGGVYFKKGNYTQVVIGDKESSNEQIENGNEIDLCFSGQALGDQKLNALLEAGGFQEKVNILLKIVNSSKDTVTYVSDDFGALHFQPIGSIEVTKYDAVGNNIEGNFSATLINLDNLSKVDVITVTKGHFVSKRNNDSKL